MKTADNLQTKRKTDTGYGHGEYVVPAEDIDHFLKPKKHGPIEILQLLDKEEKEVKYEFTELRRLFDFYKGKPKSQAKIRDNMIKLRDRAQEINIEKAKYKKSFVEKRLLSIANRLNKLAENNALEKLQEKYERELKQLQKLENNAESLLSKAIDLKVKSKSKKFILQNKGKPDVIIKVKEDASKIYNNWEKAQVLLDLAKKRVNKIKEELDKLNK